MKTTVAKPSPPVPAAKHEAIHRLLLIVGSVFFFWALIEFPAFINLVDYQGLEFSQVWGSLRFIRVPDPELLHLQAPHAHYQGSSRGGDFETRFQVPQSDQTVYRWDLKYDHNGFRNSTDLRRADIVVIGDSMVEGMTVPDAQLTTTLLAGLQGGVVANLGQYGYGPQQELAVLKRFGMPLHPRTVIWMFCEGNDLRDETEYRDLKLHPPGFWNHFLERSFARFTFRAVHRLVMPAKPPGITRSGIFTPRAGNAQTIYFSNAGEAGDDAAPGAIRDTADIIASAQGIAASRGARLIFVFVPDKFRVLHDFCRFPPESECRNWVLNDLPSRMRSALQSISPGTGFIDLTADLEHAARSGDLPYYPDDVHFSAEGHRVAAESIGKYLFSGAVY